MTYPRRGVVRQVFSVTGIVFAIFLLVGLSVATPGGIMLVEAWQLHVGGVDVTGQVDKLWVTSDRCGGNSQSTCTHLHVSYSFPADGVQSAASTTVGQDFYDGLKVGAPLAVRYLRGNPGLNEIEAGWTLFGGLILCVFGAIFAAAGAIGFGSRVREVLRGARLRDAGTMRRATVTVQEQTNMRINGRQQWRIRWRDEAGGEGLSQRRPLDVLPKAGEEITIFADPEAKLAPVWEGDTGSR